MKIRGTFCERTLVPYREFDRRSFRWKQGKVPIGMIWMLIGCPVGKWAVRKGRCRVGTKAYKILIPAKGRCSAKEKRIRKG